MTYSKRGILTTYDMRGGFRRGFSERWKRFKENMAKVSKHEEDVKAEVLHAVRDAPPEELGRKLGISVEGAKKLKDTVEFWHGKGLV